MRARKIQTHAFPVERTVFYGLFLRNNCSRNPVNDLPTITTKPFDMFFCWKKKIFECSFLCVRWIQLISKIASFSWENMKSFIVHKRRRKKNVHGITNSISLSIWIGYSQKWPLIIHIVAVDQRMIRAQGIEINIEKGQNAQLN